MITVRPVMHVARVMYPDLGWVGVCAVHGQLGTYWTSELMASLDLLGHAAHHHTTRQEGTRR